MRNRCLTTVVLFGCLLCQTTTTFGQRIFKNPNAPKKPEAIQSVAFSPDGQIIASQDKANVIKLWTIRGTLIDTLKATGMLIGFSPDGKILAVHNTKDSKVHLWDVVKEKRDHVLQIKTLDPPVRFSPKGDTLVGFGYGPKSREIHFLDVNSGRMKSTLPLDVTSAQHFCLSPDGASFAVLQTSTKKNAPSRYELELWNVKFEKEKLTVKKKHTIPTNASNYICYGPYGKTLAALGHDSIELYDPKNGELLDTLKSGSIGGKNLGSFKYDPGSSTVAFSPNGRILASINSINDVHGIRQQIVLWDVATGIMIGPLRTLPPRTAFSFKMFTCLAFNPNGRTLIAGCSDGTLWHLYVGAK